MRPRTRPPLNRRYYHTKPKIDKKDIAVLKRKIEIRSKKKHSKELDIKKKKNLWKIH